jgi:3-isopropylmalate dehydratase small subunit
MSTRRPMTLTQKILAAHARGLTRPWVQAGDLLRIRVDWTIASELAWNGMDRTYQQLGRPKIKDPSRFYLAIDHTVDDVTLKNDAKTLKLVQLSRDFAKESGIRHFYDANETILHTKFYRDLVQPGDVVLGADSHTSSHGGLGAVAVGLGGADVAVAMVLGESWIEVPEAISVEYEGTLPFGLGGKDVILRTLGLLKRNTVAMERSVEYRGSAVQRFSTDMRFTIANMTAEFGGLNGIFEPDAVVATWLKGRTSHNDGAHYYRADDDAPFVERFRIDLSNLAPQVAKPYSPDNVSDVTAYAGQPLDGLFIGACTTTEEELVLGALVLEEAWRGKDGLAPQARRLVVPGSREIEARLRERGLWQHYEKAGFRVGPPGCSMCLGVASEKAGKGEHWLSSQNRNFPNRMGEGSHAWLASGASVAASAASMTITDVRPILSRLDQSRFLSLLGRQPDAVVPEVRHEEPRVETDGVAKTEHAAGGAAPSARVRGQVQRFGDNVDTDAIIPGEFCHLKTEAELGDHAFHHVRPEFRAKVAQGAAIVVAHEGWGSGSSREQAVLALKGAGVKVVVAKSYAFIHKRNLVNEAVPYLVVRDPAFFELTTEDTELEIDLATGSITHLASGRRFQALDPSPIVQALQREGGIVPAIQRHGTEVFGALTA